MAIPALFGGTGGRVEIDETYIGYKDGVERKQGSAHKLRVVALIDRDSGAARSCPPTRLSGTKWRRSYAPT